MLHYPLEMAAHAPLVTSAGKDHLILSKQLCILIGPPTLPFLFLARSSGAGVIVLCGGFLFYRVEQGAVKRSLRNADHVTDSNGALKTKNTQLLEAKKQLEADEEA